MLALVPVAVAALATQVGIAEREWSVSSYREAVQRGRVTFNVHNYGEDPHDVAVKGPGGYRSTASGPIRPGADGSLRVRLDRPGTYTVYCTLPGHAARGMRATIRVR